MQPENRIPSAQAPADPAEQFRTLANSIHQLAWMANADGWIHWYNDRWYAYTGTSLAEMQGWGWEKVHHPDHKQRVVTFVTEAWQKGEPWELVFPLRRHDGSFRWFLTRAFPVRDAKGQLAQWIGTNTDIDDQKKAEAQLEARVQERTRALESQNLLLDSILNHSSNGISATEMIRDETGLIIDARTILANDAAMRFTGIPRELYLSKTATELDPDIMSSDYVRGCIHTLETGEPSLSQYFLQPLGRWLELSTSRMDEGHLIHVFTDVTPIKEAQLQLERYVEELQRSNTNLEEFAYAASHDLKEPIRKIHYFSDRLREQLSDRMSGEELRLFERLQQSSRRMGQLIDDLLTYAQVSRGAAERIEVDLNEVLRTVLEDLDVEIQQKGARISTSDLPKVLGNQRQFQQLFQNLVGNALKYSREDLEPEVRISCMKVKGGEQLPHLPGDEGQKPYYRITVQDNGIGFEQGDAERIFQVFTRLHGNSEFRGTGVGLSIVRKVAENHHGFVKAEGAPGMGATFILLLPA